ncbi:hypothetical protein HPB50_002028 [Hyalomma asiaticum]|uniref:Uncharacterized protein n=1 Tax=Hyalomma asiaticum TaxID=266040 RepID=A0ACB7T5M5_HYAAI|nr:hypothetical protein HPB50_002028 [Hyalomma asiaticum]
MFELLLTRLNESDAHRNAQYVEVHTHHAAMNKRIKDIERRGSRDARPVVPPPPTPLHSNDGCVPQVPRQTHSLAVELQGFQNKEATTVQCMKRLSKNKLPDVIALQESYDRAQLPGYVSTPSKRGIRHTFDALFREAMAKAASTPLLFCGDFNAPRTQWGYGADSPKGKKLARLGACRDTSPDLSIRSDAGAVAWSNSFEDLGSYDRVLCVTLGEDDCEIDVCLKARIVDWEQFRKNREQDKEEGPIEDIGEWCGETLTDVERVTKEIEWTDWRQEPPKEMAKLRHKYKDDPEAFAEEIVQTHLDRPEGRTHPGPRKKGPLPQGVVDARHLGVRITTRGGTQIPMVSKIRVLGLWLEEDGAHRELVARLQKKVAAAAHLVPRVANKRKGMKEHNVTSLIQAYALSHIAYVAAYVDWSRSETKKLNVAIHKAFKAALGAPQYRLPAGCQSWVCTTRSRRSPRLRESRR